MTEKLRIDHVGMKYQSLNGEINALEDVNFVVHDREFVSIVGPSGCGKSTLLSIISGLLPPSSGSIYLNGEKISATSRKIGYMLQKDHLFEWRSILQNVLLGLEIQKSLTQDAKDKAEHLLHTYGLYEFRHKYPSQLSGGMRQRAALIRTLITDPEILLLDEAFSALDYQTRLAVNEDIYAILKREHKTAIMVTHDIAEAISMANRVIILTKRPGTVKNIYTLTFTCEECTPLKSREAPEFRHYFQKVWKELDIHV
ncbi:MAG: ABC transporter ATP-binding protein [Dehalobacterium sp.]|jgi:NitT/TauT family transport system ATP-binding protein